MGKHTAGPWVAREQFSTRCESLGWIIEHGNGRIGWSSFATATPNEGETAPFSISGANAKLIAAAPALLEALQAMLVRYGEHDEGVTEIVEARAAIAKATQATPEDSHGE